MSLIADNVARLEIVLQSEEELYVRLRGVLRREESELIGMDSRVLEQTVEEKRALAEEARLLEESRVVVTSGLSAALGLGEGPVKLSEMLVHLGDEAGALPGYHHRLRALISSTQSLLESNESFANRSLARVQETLRMLGQAVPEETGYGPSARRPSVSGRGRLVRQAI